MKKTYLIIFLAGAAVAQPAVTAVVNAASNAFEGLPNAAIAEGSMFVAFGSNLGPATIVLADAFPLLPNLSGTSAKVTVNGASADAIMIYTLATQIAAVIPSSTPVGMGTITVTYNGQTSAPAPIVITKNSFGIFALNEAGSGPGVITFADYSLVGVNKAANPGETLLIWGTGLGPVTGDEAGGPLPGDQPGIPLELYVGGQQAKLTYHGRSGCCTGLDQIGFVVPGGVTGCSVPVAVKIDNHVSNFTSMSISANGRVCSDPSGPTGTDLQNLFNKPDVFTGNISLIRSTTQSAALIGGGISTTKEDDGSASFFKLTLPEGGFPAPLVQIVPFGACSVSTLQSANTIPNVRAQPLDAGPSIAVTGPNGSRTLAKMQTPDSISYTARLGDATPGNYLDGGTYTITGTGGADVGSFSTMLAVAQPLVWTNPDTIGTVDRGAGVEVNWTGGDPRDFVTIGGSNFAVLTGNKIVGASFVCRAKVSDGSFTVPPVVLLGLPASVTIAGRASPGSLAVGTSNGKQIAVPGLDFVSVSTSVNNSKSVTYK